MGSSKAGEKKRRGRFEKEGKRGETREFRALKERAECPVFIYEGSINRRTEGKKRTGLGGKFPSRGTGGRRGAWFRGERKNQTQGRMSKTTEDNQTRGENTQTYLGLERKKNTTKTPIEGHPCW